MHMLLEPLPLHTAISAVLIIGSSAAGSGSGRPGEAAQGCTDCSNYDLQLQIPDHLQGLVLFTFHLSSFVTYDSPSRSTRDQPRRQNRRCSSH